MNRRALNRSTFARPTKLARAVLRRTRTFAAWAFSTQRLEAAMTLIIFDPIIGKNVTLTLSDRSRR